MNLTNLMKFIYIVIYIAPFSYVRYYPFRERLRISVRALIIIYTVVLSMQAVLFCILTSQPFFNKEFIQDFRWGFIAVYAIMSFIIIKDNFFKQFFIWAIMLAFGGSVMANANFFEVIARERLQTAYPYLITNIAAILQAVILIPIAVRFLSDRILPVIDSTSGHLWQVFALITLLIDIQTVVATWRIPEDKQQLIAYLLYRHFTFLSMLMVTIVLCETLRQTAVNVGLSEKATMTEWLLTKEKERYQELLEHTDETRRIRHDLRHHFSVISAYLEENNKEKLREYINQYQKTIPEEFIRSVCSNETVNVIASYYLELARAEQIRCETNLRLPEKLNIADSDLTIIFGNLLENALDACKRQEQGERFIIVNAIMAGKSIAITIDNSYSGDIHQDETGYFSSKREGRGIGLMSTRAAVKKYNGVSEFTYAENVFRASVMLTASDEDITFQTEKKHFT